MNFNKLIPFSRAFATEVSFFFLFSFCFSSLFGGRGEICQVLTIMLIFCFFFVSFSSFLFSSLLSFLFLLSCISTCIWVISMLTSLAFLTFTFIVLSCRKFSNKNFDRLFYEIEVKTQNLEVRFFLYSPYSSSSKSIHLLLILLQLGPSFVR